MARTLTANLKFEKKTSENRRACVFVPAKDIIELVKPAVTAGQTGGTGQTDQTTLVRLARRERGARLGSSRRPHLQTLVQWPSDSTSGQILIRTDAADAPPTPPTPPAMPRERLRQVALV